MRWAEHAAHMGAKLNAYNIFIGGKRSLRRPRPRWEYIRMDLMEIRWEVMDWMHLVQ